MSQMEVRKIRKKLRQIERLERLDRDLNEDEILKVGTKPDLQLQLDTLGVSDQFTTAVDKYSINVSIPEDADNASDSSNDGSEKLKMKRNHYNELSDCCLSGKKTDLDVDNVVMETPSDHCSKPQLFSVQSLIGHNGDITALAMSDRFLITASEDTTVKVWDLASGVELRSLGGHKQTVTAVVLLTTETSQDLAGSCMDVTVDGAELQLVLSASLDSSVCIWSLDSGHYLHSVYTFNPLTSLAYIEDRSLFVTGSDGGKLELWDAAVKSPTPLCSVLDHRGAIVDIVVEKKQIYCGSSDGRITGYELMTSDPHVDPQIRQFFDSSTVSDPLTCHLPPILSLAVLQSSLYYADGSTSIKVISSSQGKLRELSNHVTESGSTDAVCIAGGLLVASGYDVDNQLGYVNVRSLPCERYEYTLCDERTSRIHCVVGGLSSTGLLTIATGSDGGPLKLWTQIAADSDRLKESAGVTVKSVYVPRFDLPTPLSISPRSTDDDKELSQSAAAAADNVTLPWRRDVTATPSRFSPWSWCSVI